MNIARSYRSETKLTAGQPLSLLCKISPLIDDLALFDVVNTPGVAADLSHISSVAVCRLPRKLALSLF